MGDLANRYGGARQSATKVIAVGDVAAEIAPPGVWSIKCPKGLRDGLIRFAPGFESSSLVQAFANGLLPREGDQSGDDTTPAESPTSVSKRRLNVLLGVHTDDCRSPSPVNCERINPTRICRSTAAVFAVPSWVTTVKLFGGSTDTIRSGRRKTGHVAPTVEPASKCCGRLRLFIFDTAILANNLNVSTLRSLGCSH